MPARSIDFKGTQVGYSGHIVQFSKNQLINNRGNFTNFIRKFAYSKQFMKSSVLPIGKLIHDVIELIHCWDDIIVTKTLFIVYLRAFVWGIHL